MHPVDHAMVMGVFEDPVAAQRAVQELKDAGFAEEHIGVVARHETTSRTDTAPETGTKVEEGAAVGMAAGVGIGALWGLAIAASAIPGVGPIIAGGILTAVLTGAGGGLVIGGIVGALVGLGVPEHEALFYEQEVHAGRTVVSVRAPGRYEEAREILQRNGAYDASSRTAATKPS